LEPIGGIKTFLKKALRDQIKRGKQKRQTRKKAKKAIQENSTQY
jgi:hypothetical protein